MASCYLCGRPRATYRREVETGHSVGFSLRGSLSSRTHYGLRSVCGACAREIDRADRLRKFVWRAVVAGLLLLVLTGYLLGRL